MAIYFCTHNPAILVGFDLRVEADRIVVNGRNACNVQEGAEPIPMPEMAIELAALKARRDWSDFALWLVGADYVANQLFPPFNLYAASANTRNDPQQQAQRDGWNYPIHIFVPTADSSFLDSSIIVYVHPELGFTCNRPSAEKAWTGQPLVDRPTLVLDAPDRLHADGTVRCGLRLLDHAGKPLTRSPEVFLEATAGYLPRPRVPLVAGKGVFAVSALGLVAGERFKVKAGFRHYSGIAEHWFEVI